MDKKAIGTIAKLMLGKGYGFIAREGESKDVPFFERTSAEACSGNFEKLFEGQTVQFQLEAGPRGLSAVEVELLDFTSGEEEEVATSMEPGVIECFVECNAKLLRYVQQHPEALDQLDSGVFEEIVAKIFQNEGFETERISSWNQADGGVDLIAIRKLDSEYPVRFAIQCKRFSRDRSVSAAPIRALAGVLDRFHAHVGVVATTTYFTRPAREEVRRHLWKIHLRDYDNIAASLLKLDLLQR